MPLPAVSRALLSAAAFGAAVACSSPSSPPPAATPVPLTSGLDVRSFDTTVRPQVLLGIVVYDSATWARVAAEPGPPQGDSLLSVAGQVFVAGLPQSNPFADGSPDFFTFDSLAVALDRVRQGFRVLR